MNHNNLSYHGISSLRVCVVHSGGVVFHVQCINLKMTTVSVIQQSMHYAFHISAHNLMSVVSRKTNDQMKHLCSA